MKATGEVMAIGTTFEQAMMKAVRCIELNLDSLNLRKLKEKDTDTIEELLHHCDDERIFVVYEALKRGISIDTIFEITKIDRWFINKLNNLFKMEQSLSQGELTQEKYKKAKKLGFLDKTIKNLSGQEPPQKLYASYKMVDTCAAEFAAETPYFYSTYDDENEAREFIEQHSTGKKKVIVFGSGPIRIGQGIEFDYCSVHCVTALKEAGYEAIIVNNNPETVSTDFDISDRLYFEPLTPEDVDSILETEQPWGVVVQFGGQTAIKLTKHLKNKGVKILGTSADSIDAAEDRERFDKLLEHCNIPRPNGRMAYTTEVAVKEAQKLGYPVLLRPSYVLGGQNMIIAHGKNDVIEYMDIITATELENPVLIDKYLMGTEVEVDAVCDGDDFLIPGIMEHIERAGVHSGDSISIYPPQTLTQEIRDTIVEYTGRLAKELNVSGLVNIQYVIYQGQVYVIEVNPRSSRTVPYISKVTNVPIVDLATKVALGAKLKDLGYGSGVCPEGDYVAVKVPVFSFPKLHDADNHLGPEMKSTGEVLGIDRDLETALYKGLIAAGYEMHKVGNCVLITVKDSDKPEVVPLAQKFIDFGYKIWATKGTSEYLREHGVPSEIVNKHDGPSPNTSDLFDTGEVDFVVSTSTIGRKPAVHSVQMRRKAIERNIACLTSIDTANALANSLLMRKTLEDFNMVDIVKI
jgi:carbamoyl-phosphate synthase large subunit